MGVTLETPATGGGLAGPGGQGSGEAARLDALSALPAGEAVNQLAGDFAEGDVPPVESLADVGPVAQAFYADDADIVGIVGPVGSGKTRTLLKSRARRMRMMPRSTIDGVRRYKLGVLRHTYRDLWSTTIPDYLSIFPRALGEWVGGRGGPVEHRFLFEDEFGLIEAISEFKAFGDDVMASMRGWQIGDLWLHETDTNPVDVFTNGITRIDRYPDRRHFAGYPPEFRSFAQIACDFNAPDEDNWTHGVFYDEAGRARQEREMSRLLPAGAKPVRISFHRQPGAREPGAENLKNLGPTYYQRMIGAMTLAGRGDQIARLVDNKVTFMRAGTPVFEREFNRNIHVASGPLEPDPDLPLLIGLDQGFTGAAVISQFKPPYHWRILGEMMFPKEHLKATEFGHRLADLLDERFTGLRIMGAWGDMAGEGGSSLAEEENATWNLLVSKAAGFTVRPQRIGANRITPRLEAVRSGLEYLDGGEPGILIDPRCRFMIAGFEARYVLTEEFDKRGNKRKVPDKSIVEANVMDALEYLLLSKVRGDGASPGSFGRPPAIDRRIGHNGGPPMAAGLKISHDIFNPYGG